MTGVQAHLGSSDPYIRKLGMVVSQTMTAKLDKKGPALNFEVHNFFELISN